MYLFSDLQLGCDGAALQGQSRVLIFTTVLFNKAVVDVSLKTDMTLGGAVTHPVSLCTRWCVCVSVCEISNTPGVFVTIPSVDSVPMLPLALH